MTSPIYSVVHIRVPADQFITALTDVISNRMTGSLTINFSQGRVAGYLEWQERKPSLEDALSIPSPEPDTTPAHTGC